MSHHEAHEEAMRQARETQLRLQQEARRIATSRFGPAVNGILWRKSRPEETADEIPQTPILSIIEFSLKPGVDLGDDSRPPRKLLDATLRYISSIPGCRGIEWGLRLDADVEAGFFCLICWDSVVAWHKFQHSLGFTPLVALLASDVSNCCAKFTGRIPSALGLGEAVRATTIIIDVVSVTFSTQDVSSQERGSTIEERWNALVASLTDGDGGNGLLHSHAVWLEKNASTFADPSPAEAAAANVSATFTAFLVWDGFNYNSHRVEHLCDGLQSSLQSSHGNKPPSTLRKSVQLINRIQPQEAHNPPQQPTSSLTSLASILQSDFPRQCSADLFNLREHARRVLDRSISDTRARTRLFPLPQGYFTSQGELHEGTRGHEGSTGLDRVEYLELSWFHLPPGALERQLFEYAYSVFTRMTVPSQQGGIPTAFRVSSNLGGWQPAEATETSDSQIFTAALTWMSPAARVEWYGELLGASLWSYELFGHKLDALKILATGGVSGRFLAMQRS
ncbi:hypothetical protein Trihar35433_1639 [Trichoderma harzianum]|nr:hypothetical protein Trihar35433_1639 [Trichoderma harzianum]